MMHKRTIVCIVMTVFVLIVGSRAAHACQKGYSDEDAKFIVNEIYNRLLLREVDDSGLDTFSTKLRTGEWCVVDVVHAVSSSKEFDSVVLRFSREYEDQFIWFYRLILQREPENRQVVEQHMADYRKGRSLKNKINDFAFSPEARATWENLAKTRFATPGKYYSSNRQQLMRDCKFLLGRKNDWVCLNNWDTFKLCEKLQKNGRTFLVVGCRFAGVDPAADERLLGWGGGCQRSVGLPRGNYTCPTEKTFLECESYRKDKRVLGCRRPSPIKTND